MTLKPKEQSRKKKINNRRKSRELVMKSVYRGLVNQIDITQIKKDIQDDPDFIRADQDLYEEMLSGVFKNLDSLKQEIELYIDRSYEELSPIELSIIYFSLNNKEKLGCILCRNDIFVHANRCIKTKAVHF